MTPKYVTGHDIDLEPRSSSTSRRFSFPRATGALCPTTG